MKTLLISALLFIGLIPPAGPGKDPAKVLKMEAEWYKSQAQINLDLIEYKVSSITKQ